MQTQSVRPIPLRLLALGIFGLIVAFHLGNALAGKSLIRASHLGTALEYAHGPINLLRPMIVGFNATSTPTALEFPLWQAATGLVFKVTRSNWYGWGNLVSLMLFASAMWPFLQLGRAFVGERAAWWGLAFMLAQPLIVIMAGEAATDGFCLALTLWFLFCAWQMIRTGKVWWWLPTAVFAALSAVSKLPFFMAAGLFTVLLLLNRDQAPGSAAPNLAPSDPRPGRRWLLLAAAGACGGVALLLWSRHADALAAQAEYPYVDLRLSHSPFLRFWYFGDWHYRLSPGPWIKGAWRFLHATLGALPLITLLVMALARRGLVLLKLWLLASFLTTLVFSHLVLGHWHYYLMYCPAVALLCGVSLTRLEEWVATEFPSVSLRLALAAMLLLFSGIDGVITMKVAIDYDDFSKTISSLLRQHTQPQDKLILYTCDSDWGGEDLFRAGRNGLSVLNLENSPELPTVKGLFALLSNPDDLKRLKALGYNKLVLVSESPVRFAVEASNPGSKRRRHFYPPSISKAVDAWPVVFQSEDLLIKDIPN